MTRLISSHRYAGVLAALLLMACSEAPPPKPAVATARSVEQGAVIGFLAPNEAQVWLGLPYGASTAGSGRWRAPQPAPPWQGTREALVPAPRCAQLTNEMDADEGLDPGVVIGSEDCLTLDIYAPPEHAGGSELPVLFWIHGGGNVWGRSSSYDGSRLAANEQAIVVAVQYRLGPLGWFAHPLLRESAETPLDAAASFATLDLIEALRWVRRNIAVFGGDPQRVTIAGESHGGYNVMTLLAAPLAKGLFHRAIIQSGGFDSMSLAEAQGDEGAQRNPSKKITARLGVQSADELRALPVASLLSAYERGSGFLQVPRVIEDGVVLPARRLREVFSSTETFNAVPLLMGTTKDEMKLFYVGDDRFVGTSWGVFPEIRDPALWEALNGYLTRLWRVRAISEPAEQLLRAGHNSLYLYRFDWDDGGSFLSIDTAALFGAAHGFEIPFLFNHFVHLGDPVDGILFEAATAEEREALSRAMGSYWMSFARAGAPDAKGEPAWPSFSTSASQLRLDVASDGGIELTAADGDSLDRLLRDFKRDTSLDPASRCLIAEEMARWMYAIDIEEQLRAAGDCST